MDKEIRKALNIRTWINGKPVSKDTPEEDLGKLYNLYNPNGYELKTKEVGDTVHMFLDNDISDDPYFGITPTMFRDAFDAADGKDVVLNINSQGGSVYAASEMSTIMDRAGSKVTAVAVGLVASAATYLAATADSFLIDKAALPTVLMHPPTAGILVMGNADNIMAAANEVTNALKSTQANMVNLYAKKTGKEKAEVEKWINDSVSFGADDAIANKFADGYCNQKTEKSADENKEANNALPKPFTILNAEAPVSLDKPEDVLAKASKLKLVGTGD